MKAGVAIRAFQAEVFPHFCSIIAHGFKIWHFDSLCMFSLPAAISVHARCGRYNWWKAWRIGMILSKTFPFQLLHFDIEVLRMGSDHHSLMSDFDVKDLVLGILKTFIEMACFIQNVFGTNKWFWTLLIWRLGLDMFFKRLQPNLSFSWSVLFLEATTVLSGCWPLSDCWKRNLHRSCQQPAFVKKCWKLHNWKHFEFYETLWKLALRFVPAHGFENCAKG